MISLIVLASGFGKRFGSNKLLYDIEGKPMYRHITDCLYDIAGQTYGKHKAELIIVTQYNEIAEYARDKDIKCVMNADAAEGISASVRKGVGAADNPEWYFFFTADQPYLKQESVKAFIHKTLTIEEYEKDSKSVSGNAGFSMVSAHSNNIPGNPTAFNRVWKDELLKLTKDVGGRKIMKEHPEQVYWVEIPEKERKDIDFKDVNI